MNGTEQEVLRIGKLTNLLIQMLLLISICLTRFAYAESTTGHDQPEPENNIQKHFVAITYPSGSTLYSNIANAISETIADKYSDINVSLSADKGKKIDLLIAIGMFSIQYINNQYPETDKLFISTDPTLNRQDKNTTDKNAILYMTQPFCKQIKFIKLLDKKWETISYLSYQNRPTDNADMERCVLKHGLKLRAVTIKNTNRLTDNIKDALNHSDILLALPNKNIYNSRTVKNILLTSYRHRKPVIAFSGNFVNAGALAAIHSSTNQIARSASTLIEQYFTSNQRFKNSINYPSTFDISINRQVFRALDIPIPDIDQLKQALQYTGPDEPGKLQ